MQIPAASPSRRRSTSGGEPPFIDIAGDSDTGRKRDRNEDAYLVIDEDDRSVLAVADGVGGTPAGDIASQTAVEALSEHLDRELEPEAVAGELERAFHDADGRVKQAGGTGPEAPGTTLTALSVSWPTATVAHAGDSRAYLYRENRLRRLTRDDTVAEEMIERHVVPAAPGESVPFEHVLTNVIGGAERELDVAVTSFELQPGDQLLICSDGLTDQISEFEIARTLHDSVTAAGACRRLIDAANRAGGEDNVTAVVARIGGQERDRRFA